MKYNQLTTETFNKKSEQIFGNKIDRSNVNYKNNTTPILLKCNINETHGYFWQIPRNHLLGRGCKKCGYDRVSEFRKNTKEEIIQKFIEVHGDRYGYNSFINKGYHTKSTIICYDHGPFEQSPANHIKGAGCPKCGLLKTLEVTRLTLDDFIFRSIEIHGNKYDYSLSDYKNNNTKIKIKCRICGTIFEQTPNAHIHQKQGCPRCKKSKGELAIIDILDRNDIDFEDEYKLPEIGDNYRFDFYLPDYRTLIEFHGKQHYEYIPHFHRKGEDEFLANKNTDDVKRYNARRWKYRLLEFNYKQLKYMSKEEFEQLVLNSIKNRD